MVVPWASTALWRMEAGEARDVNQTRDAIIPERSYHSQPKKGYWLPRLGNQVRRMAAIFGARQRIGISDL